ncbi:RNase adapter RapZ [Parafrankia sp. BMG5.11]|uniref:RapZ C-terminal domain-containing protein n=1 Tax=Parafrankia sp. BMG5.11 TaxID=222540 RepID=UPI001FB491F1|nr:RNase adapter RapZ [Parafrankia sp. BMG5.11]
MARPDINTVIHDVTVVSFGYLYGPPPAAHLILDLRTFRDPNVDPDLRDLTAHDQPVVDAVLATPGIPGLLDATETAVRAYLAGPSAGPVTVVVGLCRGRHRAAAVTGVLSVAVALPGILRRLQSRHPRIRTQPRSTRVALNRSTFTAGELAPRAPVTYSQARDGGEAIWVGSSSLDRRRSRYLSTARRSSGRRGSGCNAPTRLE